jgi:predicted amidophosphoribosyltransferase
MLFPRCKTCSKQLNATARICPRCGALTGVNTRTEVRAVNHPLTFAAATVVVFFTLVLLRWLGSLP